MKDEFEKLLQQRLTRKEFLQYAGSGVIILFGIGNLLKALQMPQKKSRQGLSYSSGVYGGVKK